MRIGFQIVLFLLILNLVSTLVFAINIPGTQYTTAIQVGDQGNATLYEAKFNSTTLLQQWTGTPFSGVPIFGDIFSGIYLMFNAIKSVVAGFPALMQSYVDLIPDAETRTTLTLINTTIGAVMSFVFFSWLVQMISGRRISE